MAERVQRGWSTIIFGQITRLPHRPNNTTPSAAAIKLKRGFRAISCNCPLSCRKEAAGPLRSISPMSKSSSLRFPPCGRQSEGPSSPWHRRGEEALREPAQTALAWRRRVRPGFHLGPAASHVSPDTQQVLPTRSPPHRIGSREFTAALGLRSSRSFMARRADTYSCSIMHSDSDVGIVAVEWFRCVPCSAGVPSFDSCQEVRSHIIGASVLVTPCDELRSRRQTVAETRDFCPIMKKNYLSYECRLQKMMMLYLVYCH